MGFARPRDWKPSQALQSAVMSLSGFRVLVVPKCFCVRVYRQNGVTISGSPWGLIQQPYGVNTYLPLSGPQCIVTESECESSRGRELFRLNWYLTNAYHYDLFGAWRFRLPTRCAI